MSYFTDWLNQYKISSRYGWRTLRGKKDWHEGLDFDMKTGDPIFSVGGGVVTKSASGKRAGEYVTVKLDTGEEVSMLHMSERKVKAGDRVKAGQLLGLAGNTGNSTGDHLDLRLKINGEWINPEEWLKGIKSDPSITPSTGLVWDQYGPTDKIGLFLKVWGIYFVMSLVLLAMLWFAFRPEGLKADQLVKLIGKRGI